jgi:ethanolamine-phosphate cytidylyltransferase
MIRGIKWVDEVVQNAPYVTEIGTLDKYKFDLCAHCDDTTSFINGIFSSRVIQGL